MSSMQSTPPAGLNIFYPAAYVTNQGAASVSVVDVQTRTKKQDITVGKKPNGIVLKN